MAVRRASASFFAIPSDGKRQNNFATPMAGSAIDLLFPDTAKTFYRKDQTKLDVPDCTGQELYKRILTGEIGDINVEFFATPKLATLLAAYGLGVAAAPAGTDPYTHSLMELPLDVYQGPVFSAIFGFKGGANPLRLRGCSINSFGFAGRARGLVTGRANIKFAEGVALAGYTIPTCVNEVPLRFGDCGLSVNAVSQAGLWRSFDFLYNLKLLTGGHAHTDEGIYATRFERDDQRERRLSYAILGDNSDQTYLDAEAGAEKSFALTLGTGNNKITFNSSRAQHDLDGGGLRKDGQANETNIAVIATPMIDGSTLPLSATVVNSQATAYLLTP